jgi:quercetin dioxygenase-like cupin family protein
VNIESFKQSLVDQDYSEVEHKTYEPGMENEMHTHDFSANLFVLKGEFTLITGKDTVTNLPGESCQLDAGILHSERAGPEGTTFLVGKKY